MIRKAAGAAHGTGHTEDAPQRFVDRALSGKCFRYIRFEQDDVCSFSISLVIFSVHSTSHRSEVVFGLHVAVTSGLTVLLHKSFSRALLLAWHLSSGSTPGVRSEPRPAADRSRIDQSSGIAARRWSVRYREKLWSADHRIPSWPRETRPRACAGSPHLCADPTRIPSSLSINRLSVTRRIDYRVESSRDGVDAANSHFRARMGEEDVRCHEKSHRGHDLSGSAYQGQDRCCHRPVRTAHFC